MTAIVAGIMAMPQLCIAYVRYKNPDIRVHGLKSHKRGTFIHVKHNDHKQLNAADNLNEFDFVAVRVYVCVCHVHKCNLAFV